MALPKTTRLRCIWCPDKTGLSAFCDRLGGRIEIKQIVWDGKNWNLFFVPDDKGMDLMSGSINQKGQYNGRKNG